MRKHRSSLRTRVARFRQEGARAVSEVAGVERPFRPPQPRGVWDWPAAAGGPLERPLAARGRGAGGGDDEMEDITSEYEPLICPAALLPGRRP